MKFFSPPPRQNLLWGTPSLILRWPNLKQKEKSLSASYRFIDHLATTTRLNGNLI